MNHLNITMPETQNNNTPMPAGRTHVAVNFFSVFYRANQAVKDITFNIPAGYVTAIIGPSGCGKSTILRAINRMNDLVPGCYVKGELLFDGQNVYSPDVDVVMLRRRVGMVFQKPNPFPKSIFDNVAYGPRLHSRVNQSERAADNQDATIAQEVVNREKETNLMEVNVEEECLKILALHQPVASDLRYIVAVLKINQDLERIGDLAVHIAERAIFLCSQPRITIPFPLEQMANKTQQALKKVLDAFVNFDEATAREVCAADSEVDNMNQEIFQQVKEAIIKNPRLFESLLQIMHISRHLERIADHATNIAEDLIYLIEGRIVRHAPEISHDKAPSGQTPIT